MFRRKQYVPPILSTAQSTAYNLPSPQTVNDHTLGFYNNPTVIKSRFDTIYNEFTRLKKDFPGYSSLKSTFLNREYLAKLSTVASKIGHTLDENEKGTQGGWNFFKENYPHEILPDGSLKVDAEILACDISNTTPEALDKLFNSLAGKWNAKIRMIQDDFRQAEKDLGIRWANYIPEGETIEGSINKSPAKMQKLYQTVYFYELAKRENEQATTTYLLEKYKKSSYAKQICKQLAAYCKQIHEIEKSNPDHPSLTQFKALYIEMGKELLAQQNTINLKYTPYLPILSAFTGMAKKLSKNHTYSEAELNTFAKKLQKDIEHLKPMSPKMKAVICGLIGAVVGAALGLVVGAAVTFWSGGIGGLPAAIAGGVVGMTVGQALVIGGVGAAAGVLTGSVSAGVGFFNAKKKNREYVHKPDLNENVRTAGNQIIPSLPRK